MYHSQTTSTHAHTHAPAVTWPQTTHCQSGEMVSSAAVTTVTWTWHLRGHDDDLPQWHAGLSVCHEPHDN